VIAKVAVLVGVVLVVGIAASVGSFVLGQPVLHGNGFVPAQGYPVISITDPAAARATVGTAVYLAVVAVLGFAVGQITCRAGSAVAVVLAVLYAPAIVSLMLAEPIRGTMQRFSPMMAGLAVQRTVERADSVPIGQLAGLAVAAAWAMAAVLVAVWLVRRRDA
jgi:ABC-2 type transport system permease protein